MKAEQEKLKVEDETLFNNWYDSLPEETQAMYDRGTLLIIVPNVLTSK